MSSEKRQRQRENRMRAAAEAERAKKRSSMTRRVVRIVLIVAAVLLALFLWSVFSGDDGEGSGDEATVTADAPDVTVFETDEPFETVEPSDDVPAAIQDAVEPETDDGPDVAEERSDPAHDSPDVTAAADPTACPAADGSDGPLSQFPAPPPVCIDNEVLYAAAFDTSVGPFTLVLEPALDPVSVNNFVVLARWGAYDGTLFHRVIEDFMIQGGDVQLQYGTGGPGYQFTGGFPAEDWYRAGALAMANRGNPASNGAQFFIVTGPSGIGLPALYSPMGLVTDGLDVVCSIEGVATDERDAPVSEVIVHSVTVTEATDTQADAYDEVQDGDRFADGC